MKTRFHILIVFLMLGAILLPASNVSAGATHTHFTAVAIPLCFTDQPDPRCSWGEVKVLPNGKTIVQDFVNVVQFIAEDDRYTGVGVVTLHIAPGSTQLFPFHATWHFTPDNYDGYWEGTISARITQEGEYSEYSAKGYGALDGLLLLGRTRGGVYHDVEIIELPGYSR